jgi:hypothetical protein
LPGGDVRGGGVALAVWDRFCVECSASAMVCPACGEPAEPSDRLAVPVVRRWLVSGPDHRQLRPPRRWRPGAGRRSGEGAAGVLGCRSVTWWV